MKSPFGKLIQPPGGSAMSLVGEITGSRQAKVAAELAAAETEGVCLACELPSGPQPMIRTKVRQQKLARIVIDATIRLTLIRGFGYRESPIPPPPTMRTISRVSPS